MRSPRWLRNSERLKNALEEVSGNDEPAKSKIRAFLRRFRGSIVRHWKIPQSIVTSPGGRRGRGRASEFNLVEGKVTRRYLPSEASDRMLPWWYVIYWGRKPVDYRNCVYLLHVYKTAQNCSNNSTLVLGASRVTKSHNVTRHSYCLFVCTLHETL